MRGNHLTLPKITYQKLLDSDSVFKLREIHIYVIFNLVKKMENKKSSDMLIQLWGGGKMMDFKGFRRIQMQFYKF